MSGKSWAREATERDRKRKAESEKYGCGAILFFGFVFVLAYFFKLELLNLLLWLEGFL